MEGQSSNQVDIVFPGKLGQKIRTTEIIFSFFLFYYKSSGSIGKKSRAIPTPDKDIIRKIVSCLLFNSIFVGYTDLGSVRFAWPASCAPNILIRFGFKLRKRVFFKEKRH